jgi:hypothetical protein
MAYAHNNIKIFFTKLSRPVVKNLEPESIRFAIGEEKLILLNMGNE